MSFSYFRNVKPDDGRFVQSKHVAFFRLTKVLCIDSMLDCYVEFYCRRHLALGTYPLRHNLCNYFATVNVFVLCEQNSLHVCLDASKMSVSSAQHNRSVLPSSHGSVTAVAYKGKR